MRQNGCYAITPGSQSAPSSICVTTLTFSDFDFWFLQYIYIVVEVSFSLYLVHWALLYVLRWNVCHFLFLYFNIFMSFVIDKNLHYMSSNFNTTVKSIVSFTNIVMWTELCELYNSYRSGYNRTLKVKH